MTKENVELLKEFFNQLEVIKSSLADIEAEESVDFEEAIESIDIGSDAIWEHIREHVFNKE